MPENSLKIFFASLNDNCSAQDRHKVPKLVQLEPPGREDSEYVRKNNFWLVCEQNSLAKHLVTPFSVVRGPTKGEGDCGTHMVTGGGKCSISGILQKC